MSALLDSLATALGYTGDFGYIHADAFADQPNHRHELRLAAQLMNVRAAFGLWTGREGSLRGPERARFTPLVFLAEVADAEHAKSVHRSVWSQGLAPYLITVSADMVWVCQGFAYSSTDWSRFATEVSASQIATLTKLEDLALLKPLHARSLRSSMAWRDEARTADEFVDERLLRSLANLSLIFTTGTSSRRSIEPAAVNALIARLLYFYFLVDRRFVTDDRLSEWDLPGIGLTDDSEWSLDDAKTLFKRLDEVFNGSIFPMPPNFADSYDAAHLNLLRQVLRHGAQAGSSGELQLGFFDYDFASIRTETLSAIYEMFLRNEDKDAGKNFGTFYTPPYLADYALDRLEDQTPLADGVRVLDPATGSGVFLVGAYRRIVETSLPKGETLLPLSQLHRLMTTNIFGVELNATACHVAAFSLYLTMLDYVDPEEVADFARWPVLVGRPRLFPPMLKAEGPGAANIRVGDFFSEVSADIRCDVVVGNPPWVQLKNLRSDGAIKYFKSRRSPIGDQQAAELFLWKAFDDHLSEDGFLAFLLPQKSLVNTYSDKFTEALRSQTELVGIADLAHLRYVLFRRSAARTAGGVKSSSENGARQSTAIVLLKKAPPTPGHRFWLYRPLRSNQPSSKNGRLWTLVHDWTQVLWLDVAGQTDRQWRRLFTCTAVDRRILANIDRQMQSGQMQSLGELKEEIGLHFKIEVDQNLDKSFVLSAAPKQQTFWRRQLGLSVDLIPKQGSAVPLPASELAKAHVNSRPFLMGNVVLLPRTCETAIFVEPPVAASFFIVACFPDFAGKPLPSRNRRFLKALAAYMSTETFRYLCFVNSRRMTIDRANVELSTVLELPWPFGGVDAQDWSQFLDDPHADLDDLVADKLGLPAEYRALVHEFTSFRKGFTDGGTPNQAMRNTEETEFDAYVKAMLYEIDRGRNRYTANICPLGEHFFAAVIDYRSKVKPSQKTTAELASMALSEFTLQGASALTQSRYLWHSRELMASVLIKPRERMHWTLDRAFADADLVTAASMVSYSNAA